MLPPAWAPFLSSLLAAKEPAEKSPLSHVPATGLFQPWSHPGGPQAQGCNLTPRGTAKCTWVLGAGDGSPHPRFPPAYTGLCSCTRSLLSGQGRFACQTHQKTRSLTYYECVCSSSSWHRLRHHNLKSGCGAAPRAGPSLTERPSDFSLCLLLGI